jgi:hypothetical protein
MKRQPKASARAFADPIAWEATLPIRASSPAWRATIKAMYGSPLTPEERDTFRELAQRDPPPNGADEFLAVVGRRGGKSETIARVACFEAVHGGHAVALAPGQVALIPIISPLREQSREIIGYVRGLAEMPGVREFVLDMTAESVRFKTNVEVRVMTADSVAVVGRTVVCAIRDELARFPGDDSATPDREIDASLRPALAPLRGAPRRRLLGITSAYMREGIAYEADRDHFGRDGADVLVVRGTVEQFNPNIDRDWLARERRKSERDYRREYLAEWQDAVQDGWFGAEVIQRCVTRGRGLNAPSDEFSYVAAIDPAFSEGGDQFALSITHREFWGQGESRTPVVVVDHLQTWQAKKGQRLDVRDTIARVADVIKPFNPRLFTDQHHFDSLRVFFDEHSVPLTQVPWTRESKPKIFHHARSIMSSGLVDLPDHPQLIRELNMIRGRLLRGGGEHLEARKGHDDLAHATVAAIYLADMNEPAWSGMPTVEHTNATFDELELAAAIEEAAPGVDAAEIAAEHASFEFKQMQMFMFGEALALEEEEGVKLWTPEGRAEMKKYAERAEEYIRARSKK